MTDTTPTRIQTTPTSRQGISDTDLLRCNSATRIRSRDAFMLMALWMERCPQPRPRLTSGPVRPTGCVLVDARDRVVALQVTGEAHAIVRAILQCPHDPRGCDIYVSRFPCAMCVKVTVQAGIRKIYFFPAEKWEVDWDAHCTQVAEGVSPYPTMPTGNGSASATPTTSATLTQPVSQTPTGYAATQLFTSPTRQKRYHGQSSSSPSSTSSSSSSPVPPVVASTAAAAGAAVSLGRWSPQLMPVRGVKRSFEIPADAPIHSSPTETVNVDNNKQHGSTNPHRAGSPVHGTQAIPPFTLPPTHSPAHAHTRSMRSRHTSSSHAAAVADKHESNYRSVQRLISNNPIAMSLYIPQWEHSATITESPMTGMYDVLPNTIGTSASASASSSSSSQANRTAEMDTNPHAISTDTRIHDWAIDPSAAFMPALVARWPTISAKFDRTVHALEMLQQRCNRARLARPSRVNHHHHHHHHNPNHQHQHSDTTRQLTEFHDALFRHAMVLAYIAARRTDDPKVGVGAVLINPSGRYDSIGWNGYPKKAAHLDYPQAGADDLVVVDDELKYDYMLHAEQNALLWRNPPGNTLAPGTTIVSTKLPCDECSPVMADCGVTCVVAPPQMPKAVDDPTRLRGLTYHKLNLLVNDRWDFI